MKSTKQQFSVVNIYHLHFGELDGTNVKSFIWLGQEGNGILLHGIAVILVW